MSARSERQVCRRARRTAQRVSFENTRTPNKISSKPEYSRNIKHDHVGVSLETSKRGQPTDVDQDVDLKTRSINCHFDANLQLVTEPQNEINQRYYIDIRYVSRVRTWALLL